MVGPFFVENSPEIPLGGDLCAGVERARRAGSRATSGPVRHAGPGARIEVWEADEDGFYDVQYGDERVAPWSPVLRMRTELPILGRHADPVPIPLDGPVGTMLAAVGRSPMRAAASALQGLGAGRTTLVTHILVDGCELPQRDSDFGVNESLVRDFIGAAARHADAGRPGDRGRRVAEGPVRRRPGAGHEGDRVPGRSGRTRFAKTFHSLSCSAFSRAGGARTRCLGRGSMPRLRNRCGTEESKPMASPARSVNDVEAEGDLQLALEQVAVLEAVVSQHPLVAGGAAARAGR